MRYKNHLIAVVVGLAGVLGFSAYHGDLTLGAAPYYGTVRGEVPATDSEYYSGTTTPSTKAWKGVITDKLCLTADTCYTSISFGSGATVFGELNDVATSSDATGDIYYLNSSGQITNLGVGDNGEVLKLASGLPSWATDSEGSATFPWTPETLGNATSTLLLLKAGAILTGSSTVAGALTVTGTITGNLTGTASLATALAANGGNCSSGSAPLGVDASGAVESCFDVWTEAENTSAAYISDITGESIESLSDVASFTQAAGDFFYYNGSAWDRIASSTLFFASSTLLANNNTFSGTNVFSGSLTGTLTGNADTATALAANGGNCSAGNSPLGVDQNGAVESCFDVWTEAENTSAAYISLTGLSATEPIRYNSSTGAFTFAFATSTALADTYILYGTAANTFGSESVFTYDDALDKLTVVNASTTGAFSVANWLGVGSGGIISFNDGDITLTHSSNSLTFAGGTFDCTACLSAGDYVAASIDGDDVNSNIAGRSLTLTSASPDVLDADNELFNKIISVTISSSSMSTTTRVAQHKFATAFTVTRVSCNTDVGAAEIDPEERGETTPNDAGTDVLSAPLQCDTNNAETTSFANASIAADAVFNFEISDAEPTGTKPTQISIFIEGTYDD